MMAYETGIYAWARHRAGLFFAALKSRGVFIFSKKAATPSVRLMSREVCV